MKKLFFTITLLMTWGYMALGQGLLPYQNPNLSAEQRAEDLCSRLTLSEKVQLMQHTSPAIQHLGIPQFNWWSEALHGVARNGFATVYPSTIGMAASFDDDLLFRVFTAVSDEARAKANVARRSGNIRQYQSLSFWTPNINIFRDPRWGRGQETYGEDPYLTSQMGLAVVRGLQGPDDHRYRKLLACAKHFAVHSGPEWNRHVFNVEDLPARDLWETYLPAFKALVQEGKVAEVMCAYQRFEGEPCCGNNRLLQQILRNEWGFSGLVTSDCWAISDFWKPGYHGFSSSRHEASAQAVRAGTDVECGSDYSSLTEAVTNGEISEEEIDVSLKRLLKARFELGDFDSEEMVDWQSIPESVVACQAHKQLALDMAHETIVLLQNRNNILPLNPKSKIMVMGPNANDSVMQWANYSGYPTHTITILQGIREKVPTAPYYQACDLAFNEVNESRFSEMSTPQGRKGMAATYYANTKHEGTPCATDILTEPINLSTGGATVFAPNVPLERFSATYEGIYRPTKDEEVLLSLHFDDMARLILDGDTVVNIWRGRDRIQVGEYTLQAKAGKEYHIKIDYAQVSDMGVMQFDILHKGTPTMDEVVNKAKGYDIVVFVGGISPRLEGEEMRVNIEGFKGGDRTDIQLPKAQRNVIAALHRAGKKVVYVNCSGSAIALEPETVNADAILQAWYPGENGGRAVADVLFGAYNPSGKLPITFYRSVDDLPDFLDYRMEGRTYRYFRGDALFPFGYGMSYTTFDISAPVYKNGEVTVNVKNTGKVEGTETVQVYIKDNSDPNGPLKSLRAFKRVTLQPKKSQSVTIDLPRERFEMWDATTNTMRVKPGKYTIMVGNSSKDKDLKSIEIKL
ncbi:MAG: glycoside hydrolase family 3 C-terminal domain-containing protein [Prevotella sp.]|nr:glycoside hydrolase family 3 C-terminal domain-containing protein [Prevotella sp.]